MEVKKRGRLPERGFSVRGLVLVPRDSNPRGDRSHNEKGQRCQSAAPGDPWGSCHQSPSLSWGFKQGTEGVIGR